MLTFPGTAFGAGEGYMRTTLLQPAELIREAVARMTAVLAPGGDAAFDRRAVMPPLDPWFLPFVLPCYRVRDVIDRFRA